MHNLRIVYAYIFTGENGNSGKIALIDHQETA